MKYLSLIILSSALLLSASCEKEIEAGDGLTQAERDYLASRAQAQCISDSANTFTDYKADSADAIMDFERDEAWKYEYKKDTTVIDTTSVSIWKVSAPNLYIRLNIVEDGTTYNKFIKIRTADNSDMWNAVQTIKCVKSTLVKSRTATLGSSTATATIEDLRINGDEADTFFDVKTVYNFKTNVPTYFGFLDRVKTKKTVDDDDAVTKTETYTYTLTKNTNPSDQNDDFTTYSNKRYCMIAYTPAVPPATENTFAFPYTLTCTDNAATGVDIDGDTVADFLPNTELDI